jgi:hypothetical protein
VLLLVMQAELEPRPRAVVERAGRERMRHAAIDRGAIGVHAIEARVREHAPARPLDARADRLVVAVEQELERRIKRLAAEHERLEEPGGVCEVPLRGARVGHRLDDGIFRRQRSTQLDRPAAHPGKPVGQDGLYRMSDRAHGECEWETWPTRPIEATAKRSDS